MDLTATLTFDAACDRLRAVLEEPLPGPEAQYRLAPGIRTPPSLRELQETGCRQAGVLCLLFPLHDRPAVVLTVRPDHMAKHPGQISFPGGRQEPGETHLETALREAREEVNLDTGAVEVLGPLTPLYIPPSHFCVYPYVAVVAEEPDLLPHDAEVAEILHIPLPDLFHADALQTAPWKIQGQTVQVPYYDVPPHRVWGATAMMLSELQILLGLG